MANNNQRRMKIRFADKATRDSSVQRFFDRKVEIRLIGDTFIEVLEECDSQDKLHSITAACMVGIQYQVTTV